MFRYHLCSRVVHGKERPELDYLPYIDDDHRTVNFEQYDSIKCGKEKLALSEPEKLMLDVITASDCSKYYKLIKDNILNTLSDHLSKNNSRQKYEQLEEEYNHLVEGRELYTFRHFYSGNPNCTCSLCTYCSTPRSVREMKELMDVYIYIILIYIYIDDSCYSKDQ